MVKKQENTGTLMKSRLIFAVLVVLLLAAASTTALHAEEEDTKELLFCESVQQEVR